jgi:hypothetical protein
MNVAQISQAIIAGNFSNEELTQISNAIQFARGQLAKQNKRSLTLGATARFKNSRTGMHMTGNVTKIAIKFVTLNCGASGSWKVPANMLEVV